MQTSFIHRIHKTIRHQSYVLENEGVVCVVFLALRAALRYLQRQQISNDTQMRAILIPLRRSIHVIINMIRARSAVVAIFAVCGNSNSRHRRTRAHLAAADNVDAALVF